MVTNPARVALNDASRPMRSLRFCQGVERVQKRVILRESAVEATQIRSQTTHNNVLYPAVVEITESLAI